MKTTILHIGDFHLSSPDSNEEFLSNVFFDEYVRSFTNIILGEVDTPINFIVCTGDIVDKGSVKNYPHGRRIIEALANDLQLKIPGTVFVCPGNHDVEREPDRTGNTVAAREQFNVFSEGLRGIEPDRSSENGRYALYQMTDGVWCMLLDSTLGSGGENMPSSLSGDEENAILATVKERIGDDAILFIASHHPMISPENFLSPDDDPDWEKKHVWRSAASLGGRIATFRQQSHGWTIMLAGDTHAGNESTPQGIPVYTVGRFGGRVQNTDTLLCPQAKIIAIDLESNDLSVRTIEYKPIRHEHRDGNYNWSIAPEIVRHRTGRKRVLTPELSSVTSDGTEPPVSPAASQETDFGSSSLSFPRPEIFDGETEQKLKKIVANEKLYHFGRFYTGEETVSLSWVCMGPLFNTRGFIQYVIRIMAKKVEKIKASAGEGRPQSCVLVGVDCWGAALASQVSVFTGVRNYCIGTRGKGEFHDKAEGITEEIAQKILESQHIILVCDVLSTGQSINFVYKQVASHMPPSNTRQNSWIALSVISDPQSNVPEMCSFLAEHWTICNSLQMPVIPKNQLPDETFLPSQISFAAEKP